MKTEKDIYRSLQRHLDSQPVGYPKTLSGADIRLLQYYFTPEEAQLAMHLSYRFTSVESLLESIGDPDLSDSELSDRLLTIAKKGGILYRTVNGQDHYALVPLIVGMYEARLELIDQPFLKDFNAYTESLSFGISFLSTHLPQMRTIPIEESVTPDIGIQAFDDVSALLVSSAGPFVVVDCICRKAKRIEGTPCSATSRHETCLAVNRIAESCIKTGIGRKISKDEAISLIRNNVEDGLILQPSNTKEIDFICSCCGCCCGMIGIQNKLSNPADYWATNYFAEILTETCTGCGLCVKRCQVNAIIRDPKPDSENRIRINLKKCIGCGNCIATCKFDGVRLVKKARETVPPLDHDTLYETILQNKGGWLSNLGRTVRLILGF